MTACTVLSLLLPMLVDDLAEVNIAGPFIRALAAAHDHVFSRSAASFHGFSTHDNSLPYLCCCRIGGCIVIVIGKFASLESFFLPWELPTLLNYVA
jgi:hypothetical protein